MAKMNQIQRYNVSNNMINNKFLLIALLSSVFFMACEDDIINQGPEFKNLAHIYSNVNTLKVEVAYEENAAPFITSGGVIGSSNVWSFTTLNMNALIDGRTNPSQISTDSELSQMVDIPNQNKNSYSKAEMIELANQFVTGTADETSSYISLLFLDGLYRDGAGNTYDNVLGINLGSALVTVIFKPVINSINVSSNEKANIEQATVVHELGHALGLVNNGVDMTSQHQDDEHGKHCTNTDCVMYWLNEGPDGAATFIGGPLFGTNNVVFGQECLDDVRNFNP